MREHESATSLASPSMATREGATTGYLGCLCERDPAWEPGRRHSVKVDTVGLRSVCSRHRTPERRAIAVEADL